MDARMDSQRVFNVPAPDFEGDCQQGLGYLFFPPNEDDDIEEDRYTAKRREHDARRVCAGCPFLIECALHGLEHEEYGIWGALTEADRRSVGGRGKGTQGARTVASITRDLRRAGIPEHQARALFALWQVRLFQIEREAA